MSLKVYLLKTPDNVLAHAVGNHSKSFLDWLTEPWIQLPTINCIKVPKLPGYNELCILLSSTADGSRGPRWIYHNILSR